MPQGVDFLKHFPGEVKAALGPQDILLAAARAHRLPKGA